MSKLLNRRLEIIRQLSNLSKDGWSKAVAADYEPLERELRQLDADSDQRRRVAERNKAHAADAFDGWGAGRY